jgi:hypothetical protein
MNPAQIELLALTSAQLSLSILIATGNLPKQTLLLMQDALDAISKALAEHNAAQTDQTAPLDPLDPVA